MRQPREFELQNADEHRHLVREVRRHGMAIVRGAFPVGRIHLLANERLYDLQMNADRLLTNVHCALATEILGVGWQPTEKDYDSSPAAVMGWWIPLHQVTDGWLFFMPGDAMILTNWAPTQVKNWLVVYTRPHINVCFQGRGTVPTGSRWHRFLRRFS